MVSSAVAFIPVDGPVINLCLSVFAGLVGNHDIPPPPEGSVHYTWDEHGAIQIQTDQNTSGGGDTAHGTAGNVLELLQSVMTSYNAQQHRPGPKSATTWR